MRLERATPANAAADAVSPAGASMRLAVATTPRNPAAHAAGYMMSPRRGFGGAAEQEPP